MRGQAERFTDMGLGLLRTTDKILGHADAAMRIGQVTIQRQRVFAFADALNGAVGKHLHGAEDQMGPGIVRIHRQRAVQHGLGRRQL